MAVAIVLAGYLGINPPGFAGEVVALAFGLACASFFPVLVLGIFWKGCTGAGAAAGMAVGISVTLFYMIWTVEIWGNNEGIFGIEPVGFGFIGMLLNLVVTVLVSQFTTKPSETVQQLVEDVRYPGTTALVAAHAAGELAEEDLHDDRDEDPRDGSPGEG